jgi:hypothetical protein
MKKGSKIPMELKVSQAKAVKVERQANASVRVSGEDLPRKSLEDCVKVAERLHNGFAGKATPWDDLADALKIGRQTNSTKYLFWSAAAYGLVNKEAGNSYSLSETGRKILAPVFEGEDRDAKIKGLLTPSILSKFYTDYNGHTLPSDDLFPNVLERKYGVPRDRLKEAQELILSNARFAGIVRVDGDKKTISLGADSVVATTASEPSDESAALVSPSVSAEWDKICFYITPIGDDGSEVRKHSDMMLKHLVDPALSPFGLKVIRADRIEKSGLITQQVLEHIVYSKLCVVDLSFNNPNVFYELGIRHMCRIPAIQIIRKGDKIPFDVSQGRTISVDTSDVYTIMDKFDSAKKELVEHVKSFLAPDAPLGDNPVAAYLPGLRITIPSPKKTGQ